MPSGKRNEVSGGSALGAMVTLAAAVAVAYLLPEGETKKPGRARGLEPQPAGRDAPTAAAHDAARGRMRAIPPKSRPRDGKDILLRVYGNISDHRVLALAAGMTFYSLLAIFPALAALVAVYGLFADPGAIAAHLNEVSGSSLRRARCGARSADPGRLERRGDARGHLRDRPCRLLVERQRGHEVSFRHAEYCLRGAGETRLYKAERDLAHLYRGAVAFISHRHCRASRVLPVARHMHGPDQTSQISCCASRGGRLSPSASLLRWR